MIEKEFIDWLTKTDTNILVCWDLGHIWDKSIYDDYRELPHGAFLLIGSCQRECGVRRSRYLTSSWSPDSAKNSYDYPHNYSPKNMIRGGFFMDAAHRARIRQEIARRAKEEKTLESARNAGNSNVTPIKFKPA